MPVKSRKGNKQVESNPLHPTTTHVEPVDHEANNELPDKYAHVMTSDFDFLTEMLCTDRVIQILIIMMTGHLFYLQNYSTNTNSIVSDNSSMAIIFNSLVSFVCCLIIFIRKDVHKWNLSNFDSTFFNLFYLFLIPMALTFYFLPTEYLALTGTLVLNSLPINGPLRIPLMGIFMIFQLPTNVNNYYNTRLHFFKSIIVNFFLESLLSYISGHRKSLSIVETNLFSIVLTYITFVLDYPLNIPFQILQKSLYALATTFVLQMVYILSLKFIFNVNIKQKSILTKLFGFSLTCLSFPFFLYQYLSILPGFFSTTFETPPIWLMLFLTENDRRLTIISIWGVLIFASIPLLIGYVYQGDVSLNFSRKFWHFLLLFIIAAPWKYDPELVKVSLSGVIGIFLIIESLRICGFLPEFVIQILNKFADHRDQRGPLLISYIYLIIGASFPILLDNDLSGIILLGLGDSLASIVGKKFGKRYWADSNEDNKKTYEGTVAFVLACYSFEIIYNFYLSDYPASDVVIFFQQYDWNSSFFSFATYLVAGILEGNATLNDNILLPAYTMVLKRLLK
ncbi:unnamed protein product [Hanseniaspora opuntiae]